MKENNTNLKKNVNFKEKIISFIKFFIPEIFLAFCIVFFIFVGLFIILNNFDIIISDKINGIIKLLILSFLSTICFSFFFFIIFFFDWLISIFGFYLWEFLM